jgi:hypothetical protein
MKRTTVLVQDFRGIFLSLLVSNAVITAVTNPAVGLAVALATGVYYGSKLDIDLKALPSLGLRQFADPMAGVYSDDTCLCLRSPSGSRRCISFINPKCNYE